MSASRASMSLCFEVREIACEPMFEAGNGLDWENLSSKYWQDGGHHIANIKTLSSQNFHGAAFLLQTRQQQWGFSFGI